MHAYDDAMTNDPTPHRSSCLITSLQTLRLLCASGSSCLAAFLLDTVHTDCDRSILTRSIERSFPCPHSRVYFLSWPSPAALPSAPALHPHPSLQLTGSTRPGSRAPSSSAPCRPRASAGPRSCILPGLLSVLASSCKLTRDAVLQLSRVETSVERHAAGALDSCCQRCLVARGRCDNDRSGWGSMRRGRGTIVLRDGALMMHCSGAVLALHTCVPG